MSIKINALPNISFPNQLDIETDRNTKSANNSVTVNVETSSAGSFHTLAGQMRKLQLLQKFASADITNNKPIQANFATSTRRLSGNDDEIRKETQRLIENFRRQIKPKEIKGAPPAAPGMSPGHANSDHRVKPEVQSEIMNNPERIFSGKNDNGRYVDIYYKNGSAVITEQGNKGSVITAYGLVDKKKNIKVKAFILEKITNNPNYVEIKLEKLGSTNVIYPNKPRFEANDFPPGPPKTNVPPKMNGGGSNAGETAEIKPNAANPAGAQKVPAANEPPVSPKAPQINEELPPRSPLGKLSGNISRGLVIMQLVQVGLTALNFSTLEADGEKFGYYIDPFFDKYVITNPEKAAKNLPEGFELKFFTDPNDYALTGQSLTFTVRDGEFFNAEGYVLSFNKEKGFVEAVLLA